MMRNKILLLCILNHVALILGLFYSELSWLTLSFVGWILFGKIGGEIGLHRYFCHKSFKTNVFYHYVLAFSSIFNGIGSPISWSALHRMHHKVSDTDLDPHGNLPKINVWSTQWRSVNIEKSMFKDLIRDKFLVWTHRHYFKIYFVFYGLLLFIDWRIPVFLISVPSVVTFHSAALVNIFCHGYGYRNFSTPDKSTNNLWVNLVTLGSGLHNNHHAKPNSYSNKLHWYEFDFPGFLIKYLLKKKPQTEH